MTPTFSQQRKQTMTHREMTVLKTLDRDLNRNPDSVSSVKVRLYRSLLVKYVSELSLAFLKKASTLGLLGKVPASPLGAL